jgi:peptidoglycan/xylan/chitin deacetylase (PgdA/CDA1 family)
MNSASVTTMPKAMRVSLPVLMYHDVGLLSSNRRFRSCVLEPSQFAEHLAALQDAGFVTEPASRIPEVEASVGPSKPIVITFDDAYVSFAEAAAPELARYKMTATVFVPTAYVGGRSMWMEPIGEGDRHIMSWQALRDVRANGMEIGSHGHEHLQLDVVPRDRLVSDASVSRHLLEQELGEPIRTFAYPFGFHNRRVREVIRDSGYELAFEVANGLYHPAPDRHYAITRIHVGPNMDPKRLLASIRRGHYSSFPVRQARSHLEPVRRTVDRERRRLKARLAAG